ncbi:MAG: DUF11 domain-containing protein [Planctomycetaceae bacterium]|jgi:uncharacterized repeat protein (TIGR01451 family)|nr:DUF11 domain-containing protein [Planctomycetaceae bacterium]
MRYFASIIGFLLLSGVVSAQQGFHTGFPSEPVRGYFQPVLIRTPEGTSLACVTAGQFSERLPSPLQAGMLIRCDYRLRITGIPYHPGSELFPTVTLLARTYPPQGREREFPIIINLTQEDLELAMAGRYVVRVIYLENPHHALPIQTSNDEQLSHDIQGGDPVAAAATQGLPVAIVRIGGRVPPQDAANGMLRPDFCFGSPPWILNRTIAPEQIPLPQKEQVPLDSLTIDPALKEAGLAVIEQRQAMQANIQQMNAWRPPHQPPGVPGGRAEEYLVNGDNTGKPAYVEDWTVHNFNAGNTIAHFDTLGGQVVVEPSNQIHIYAPRFGSIRKVEGLLLEDQVTALVEARSQQSSRQKRNTLQTDLTEQEENTRYARMQDQLHGIEGQRRGTGIESTQGLGNYDNYLVVDSDSMILLQRTFGFGGSARTQLERGAMNARAWLGSEGLRVQMNELAPMSATGVDEAALYFQVEDRQSRTSKLRLIKVASKESAQPGEIIEFTLRFDNMGNQLIGNVTILDDLTGRLEFLPGTATASLASGFVPKPNASGGLTMRFEITDPLAPGDFGVIQFKCRVR